MRTRSTPKTRLSDLLSDQQFGEILDKLLEMKELRTRLLDESVGNPIYSALAADIVYPRHQGLPDPEQAHRQHSRRRRAMKLGKSMMNRAAPKLEGAIEERLKGYVSRNIQSIVADDEKSSSRRCAGSRGTARPCCA